LIFTFLIYEVVFSPVPTRPPVLLPELVVALRVLPPELVVALWSRSRAVPALQPVLVTKLLAAPLVAERLANL